MNEIIQWVIVGIAVVAASVYMVLKLRTKSSGSCNGCCDGCKSKKNH